MKKPRESGVRYVTSADGTKIAYEITGNGPLVICIFGAICHRNFPPIRLDVKALSRGFTVVNYDRRGRGDSTENSAWSMDKELQDIEALIAENGGKAILYGHSSGAVLALEATARLGDMIEKTIIYDASYVGDQKDKEEFARLEGEVRTLIDGKLPGRALKVFLSGIGMPKLFVYLLPLLPGWSTMKKLAQTLLYDMALTHDFPPVDEFKNIRKPVVILAGGKSPNSLHKVWDTLKQTVPHNQSVLLPDQDHMVGMDKILPYIAK